VSETVTNILDYFLGEEEKQEDDDDEEEIHI
jgi:hypothetical protein